MEISDEIVRSLLEVAPNIILIVDKENKIQYMHHSIPTLDLKDAIGTDQLDYVEPEYRQMVREKCEGVFQTGETTSYELRGAGPEQEMRWYATHVSPIKSDSEVIALGLFVTDITEMKNSEKALDESESKYQGLLQNIPGMIYRGNPDWSIQIMHGCEELCGYTPEEIYDKEEKWAGIIHPDDRDAVYKEGSSITNKVSELVQTYRIVTKEGGIRWVEDRKTSFFDEKGVFTGVDGILFDISERKKTEEELRKTKDSLISQQNQAIRELSTPVIQVWDDILILPLIGTVDTMRAQQVTENLLNTIISTQSSIAIIDITGVPIIDTRVADHFLKTIRAVEMLGAHVVVSGISPNTAQTLVTLGIDLKKILTVGSLQRALKLAFKMVETEKEF